MASAESICVRTIYGRVFPINWQFGGFDCFALNVRATPASGDYARRIICDAAPAQRRTAHPTR